MVCEVKVDGFEAEDTGDIVESGNGESCNWNTETYLSAMQSNPSSICSQVLSLPDEACT